MSHISIVLSRAAQPTAAGATEPASPIDYVSVTYIVPHDSTDAQVGQAVKKLYKQVRNLGA